METRFNILNKKLNIDTEDIIVPEKEPEVKAELVKKDFDNNPDIRDLNVLYTQAESVVNNSLENIDMFKKSRDIEAFSMLMKSMIELKREIRETKTVKEKESENDSTVKNTQNNFYVGDFRQLNDLLNKK